MLYLPGELRLKLRQIPLRGFLFAHDIIKYNLNGCLVRITNIPPFLGAVCFLYMGSVL